MGRVAAPLGAHNSGCDCWLLASTAPHLVAAELHAGEVVPLDVQLAPGRNARHRPCMDGRGQLRELVPLLGQLQVCGIMRAALTGNHGACRQEKERRP